jgi:hypothetical protein
MTIAIEIPGPGDMQEIWDLLASRPVDNWERWQVPIDCEWRVGKVKGVIEAVAIGRIDPQGYIFVEHMEARYENGNPTPGAIAALPALENMLHDYADAFELDVIGTTTLTNFRHMNALKHRGYEKVAYLWRRPPHAKRIRNEKKEGTV